MLFLCVSYSMQRTFSTLLAFRNVFLISLIVFSWYMMTLLCRHTIWSRHLQNTNLSPKASPEQRALQTLLLLMSFFLVMSTLDGILSYSRTMSQGNPTLYCVQTLVDHGYATVGLLLVISNGKHRTDRLISMCEWMVNSWYSVMGKLCFFFFLRWTNVLAPELWIMAECPCSELNENVELCLFCLIRGPSKSLD